MTLPTENMLESALGNPAWVDKLMSGDAGARSIFDGLMRRQVGIDPEPPPPTATDVLTSPDTGASFDLFAPDAAEKLPGISTISGPHDMSDRQKLDLIETMRGHGTSDSVIAEAFDESRTYTAEMRAEADRFWQGLASDPTFRQRLLNGDTVAARQWRAHAIIMSGNVKG